MDSLQPLLITSFFIALIPTVLTVATSYLKISIVLGMIKNALGTTNIPGIMITASLSLVLTGYVMKPVVVNSYDLFMLHKPKKWNLIEDQASRDAFVKITEPLKDFFVKHSGSKEIDLFKELHSNLHQGEDKESVFVLLPAFVLTELREAFQMSCYLLLPFLVIDILVATLLGGMGLYMVSPISIALPLKLLLFVMSDCWLMITKGLVASYQ